MEGKTIVKVLELESGYMALRFDDGEVAIVKVVTPDLSLKELQAFVGESAKPEKKEKPKKNEPEAEEEETVDEDTYTWGDLEEMDYKALSELCVENQLQTDPDDYDKDEVDELRREIAEEIGVEAPEEEDESEEEEETEEEDESEEEEDESEEEEEEETEDDEYTWDDLKSMDYDELTDLCDESELNTDPNDYGDDEEEKLRRAIAEELGIKPPKPAKKKK